MRTRTFSEQEKQQIREQMMEVGIPLLKEYGMAHMSVTKLTEAAKIGKSTFYNFYDSKEQFVSEMLSYHRRKFFNQIQNGLQGREKYSLSESKELVRSLFTEENNIYQHFTTSDEIALKKYKEGNGSSTVDIEKETKIMKYLFGMMSGVREEPEYAAIANLVKVIVLSSEHRWLLHECGYSRTKEILIDSLLQLIFIK